MPLQIVKLDNGRVRMDFDNVVSIWNLLKYLIDTPYLKQYIIDNYEGGNTLVPKETWHEEGIMFKELPGGAYLFPYDCIGFIVDDSIHNLTLYPVDTYSEDYKTATEVFIQIRETEEVSLTCSSDKLPLAVSLYLLSKMKLGFDWNTLQSLAKSFELGIEEKIKEIEYIESSLVFNVKNFKFLVKQTLENNESYHYQFIFDNKKFRKDLIKEENIKNIGYLKKKILSKNKYFPFLFSLLGLILAAVVFILNRKLLVLLIAAGIVISLVYAFFKKNAHRIFVKKSQNQ